MISPRNNLIIYRCFRVLHLLMIICAIVGLTLTHQYLFAGLFAALFFIVGYELLKKQPHEMWSIGGDILRVLIFVWPIYNIYAWHKRDVCQAKFGLEFNIVRHRKGVPEIPNDWHSKGTLFSVEWAGKKGIIGHESKDISIDRDSCNAILENDEYHFKPIDNITRKMGITTVYAKGNGQDSVRYYYSVGDSGQQVSRQQADSIFKIEKVKSDY